MVVVGDVVVPGALLADLPEGVLCGQGVAQFEGSLFATRLGHVLLAATSGATTVNVVRVNHPSLLRTVSYDLACSDLAPPQPCTVTGAPLTSIPDVVPAVRLGAVVLCRVRKITPRFLACDILGGRVLSPPAGAPLLPSQPARRRRSSRPHRQRQPL
eukprot:gnl/Ergobibamus_cyprinoides/1621.p2 GENE.gnl/Ergobibamus_cyprinoides/1621~~gnl/Ergobibamus_cyprinoides/1621.p2  ORF type:complete len:157 (+),score=7.42 gnl/Ergobibamus_cyprinoides/1621:196-666(+)